MPLSQLTRWIKMVKHSRYQFHPTAFNFPYNFHISCDKFLMFMLMWKPNQTHPIHCLETSWWLKGLRRLKPDGLHLLRWSGFLEMRRSGKHDCSQTLCMWNSSEPFCHTVSKHIQYSKTLNLKPWITRVSSWLYGFAHHSKAKLRSCQHYLKPLTDFPLNKKINLELADVSDVEKDCKCTNFVQLHEPPPGSRFSLKPDTLGNLNFISAVCFECRPKPFSWACNQHMCWCLTSLWSLIIIKTDLTTLLGSYLIYQIYQL